MPDSAASDRFFALIDECQTLIESSGVVALDRSVHAAEPLPSLLEQCRALTSQADAGPEPVRTVHHFACTGGTLIAKCLASMPNTRILSEVEPHSRLPLAGERRFFPTDLIQLLRVGTYSSSEDLETEVFLRGLSAVYEDSLEKGLRLVLRDHAHSKYCMGTDVVPGPSLRESLASRFATRSIVTVRHPLDSFLSLQRQDWLHFEPETLEEYCRRYHRFLDEHAGLPLFRYERFVDDPAGEARQMCGALGLPFAEDFESTFSVHRLSGDSGRSSGRIGRRERRAVPGDVAGEAEHSGLYRALCSRLEYQAG